MQPLIETINLLTLASGDQISLQIYKFIGNKSSSSSNKAYIQSNLHGSEIVGNAVIFQLINFLSSLDKNQLQGEIWLVPVCNPLGTNQRSHFFATGRYNSYDGKDWNRIFWDYEKVCKDLDIFTQNHFKLDPKSIRENFLKKQQEAFTQQFKKLQNSSSLPWREQYRCQLQSLSMDADYVIDIHSSSNQGIDYIYCFHGREESAKYFNIHYGILMNEYDGDAFDEAFMKPWLALERKLNNLEKDITFDIESWTLELGSGMQMNPKSVAIGVQGIKNYLVYKKMLNLPNYSPQITDITLVTRQQIQYYYAPTGGMIQNQLPLKSRVKTGDRLYQLLSFNKESKPPTIIDIQAETDGFVFDIGYNYAVNQGEYVLAMLNFDLNYP